MKKLYEITYKCSDSNQNQYAMFYVKSERKALEAFYKNYAHCYIITVITVVYPIYKEEHR